MGGSKVAVCCSLGSRCELVCVTVVFCFKGVAGGVSSVAWMGTDVVVPSNGVDFNVFSAEVDVDEPSAGVDVVVPSVVVSACSENRAFDSVSLSSFWGDD